MSVSVEGVSALVAEFVGVAVLDVFLAAVGAFIDLVHTRQIDHLCVSTGGAVVLWECLVENFHDGGDFVERPRLRGNLAEDSDSEVALEVFVDVHVSEVFVNECVQEELVFNLGVALVCLEQVHHFGDLDDEVRVDFALGADAEEIVLGHVCLC